MQEAGITVEAVPLTSNFWVDRAGITFIYPTFAIGPHASGEFKIKLRWAEVQPYLKKDSPVWRMIGHS